MNGWRAVLGAVAWGGVACAPSEPAAGAVVGELPDVAAQREIRVHTDSVRARLLSTEPGAVLWNTLEAHGGVPRWLAAQELSFRYRRQPVDPDAPLLDVEVATDLAATTLSLRQGADPAARLEIDGERIVLLPDHDAFGTEIVGWERVPWMWMGLPFTLMDRAGSWSLLRDVHRGGRRHRRLLFQVEQAGLADPCREVMMEIDAETFVLRGAGCVLSWPTLTAMGREAEAWWGERISQRRIGGLLVPVHLHVWAWSSRTGEVGDILAEVDLSGISVGAVAGEVPDPGPPGKSRTDPADGDDP